MDYESHTPRPWTLTLAPEQSHADHVIFDATGNTIAEVNAQETDFSSLDNKVRNISREESIANAMILRAAPGMLATLVTIAEFAPGNGDVCEIIARRARAAIKSALSTE